MAVRGGSPGIPRSVKLLQLAAAVVIGSVLLVWESMQVVAQDCSATKHCANSLCCSQYNYCGPTAAYCGDGCLSGPCSSGSNPTPVSGSPPAGPAPGGSSGVGSIITASIFHQFFLHSNDAACPAAGTYTYSAFLTAAASFPQFGNVGDTATRRKELAAFLAHCSHETTGGWPTAPDGPYAWGLCFKEEIGCPADGYCDPSSEYPCAPGKSYCGRGSLQLTWNYNYGQAGDALNLPLLTHPELVENDHVLVWKTAIWFWMTAQTPKPSAHAVITGQWTPSPADKSANRLPGFGATTNIVNGGIECGHGGDPSGQNRIGFFQRYTGILGVSPGSNLDCGNQRPWG